MKNMVCYRCGALQGNDRVICEVCGRALVVNNRYEILEEIKSGAMGCVYRAYDRSRNGGANKKGPEIGHLQSKTALCLSQLHQRLAERAEG